MKTIPLSRGYVALVDDADYDWLIQRRWSAVTNGIQWYATSYIKGSARRRPKYIQMHRLIMPPALGEYVDHIDGNGLNNQRVNLRLATHAQNSRNRRRHIVRTPAKGVRFRKGRWEARIGFNYKIIHIGCFGTFEEAVKAYDTMAISLYGDFALTNVQTGHIQTEA